MTLYHIDVPILLPNETVIIDFDVVENDLKLLGGQEVMELNQKHCIKYRNFTYFTGVESLWKPTV